MTRPMCSETRVDPTWLRNAVGREKSDSPTPCVRTADVASRAWQKPLARLDDPELREDPLYQVARTITSGDHHDNLAHGGQRLIEQGPDGGHDRVAVSVTHDDDRHREFWYHGSPRPADTPS
jgi:hypothetical protein